MHIGFVVYGGLDRVSGGFLYDRQVVAGLRALGHTVEVVGLPWWSYRRALAANLLPLPAALGRCQVVIEDELIHPAVFLRHRRLRRAGVRIVSLVHNLAGQQPGTPRRWLVERCERAYMGSVDGVVTVSEDTLRDIRAQGGAALPAVVAYAGRDHLPSGMDPEGVAARALQDGPLRVVCVGIVAPHKGVHRLVEALARVPDAPVVLEVAGSLDADRAYLRRVRALIERHRLAGRVTFHGQLDPAGLTALLRRAQVFALPSDRESYPISAIEALGFGLPLLITSEGGTAELAGAAGAGQLLGPDDVAGWAGAMAALARDRARLASAARAALARYREHGTWLDTAKVVSEMCERTLAVRS